eukprot:TRINITY_DN1063_c0_g2_i2.p1 TRINITY_DN1063_c0_g2~~TRINITY_DN1063_c0_g2_i2.p1  ORF type:complete len:290 (+),score=101.24 TRINITY_DN1063_c0_g2_i2:53-922(+)
MPLTYDAAAVERAQVECRALRDCDREGSARLYADIQGRTNPLLRALKATEAELVEYGKALYDHCAPYESRAAVTPAGQVVGLCMVMEARELHKVVEHAAMGPCRVHLALMKYLQMITIEKYRKHYPARPVPDAFLYSVYSGMLPEYEGKGVFSALMNLAFSASYHNRNSTLGWGVTLNQDFVVEQIKSRSTIPEAELAAQRQKAPITTALTSYLASGAQYAIEHGPAWVQRYLSEMANYGDLRGNRHILIAYDTRRFCYEGKYPFKDYLIGWVITNSPGQFAHTMDAKL